MFGAFCLIRLKSDNNLKEKKVWKAESLYFDVSLETSFRSFNLFSNYGDVLYKLYFDNLNEEYDFNKLNIKNSSISIIFLDEDGFKLFEKTIKLSEIKQMVDSEEKGEIEGFLRRDEFNFINSRNYRDYKDFTISWTITFFE